MSRLEASTFLRLAIAGEAGLLVIAWGAGRWIGISPLGRLQLTFGALALGAAAAFPLLLGLRWALTTRVSSVRRLVSLVEEQLGPVLLPRSPAELAFLAILAGLAEEILFRGVLQAGLALLLPAGVALVIASLLFGLAHFVTPTYAVLAAVAGLYLGTVFLLQGNLLVPIVAHAVYDFVALTYLVRRYGAVQNALR
ncbi:MAG TPA: CPBP family intramembrane glutamic endopeptidase [Gemmatimonadales bacterium]|nr:CPBP family intramembrane glutamic endopeptidase [Gemmatimonadales bacterium]